MKKLQNGFTLIEMLVVIAIIALLAAIVIPAVTGALDRAKTVKCLANLRSIGQGIISVGQDDEGRFPLGLVGSGVSTRISWVSQLRREYYNLDSDVLIDQGNHEGDVFTCPSAAIRGGSHHYSCHPVLMPFRSDATNPGKGYPMDTLENASSIILVADVAQRPAMLGQSDAQFYSVGEAYRPYDPSRGDNDDPIDPGPNEDSDSPPGRGYFRWRHNQDRFANFLFADGHVETRRMDQVLKGDLRVPAL